MENASAPSEGSPAWKPIASIDRRVLGVLVEKAKTTPDAYPMSLNALTSGCNQKNNRAPLTQYVAEDVAESLERLRELGAVAELHGDGRIARYKHRLYEWLGVDKVELAVMAELLLRGAQTIGELRGRAARMEPIADLAALRPILDALVAKGLVFYVTPPQRGAVVSHSLYRPEELDKVRREHEADGSDAGESRPAEPSSTGAAAPREREPQHAQLTEQVRELTAEVNQLRVALETSTSQLRRDVDDLRRQLGV